MRVYVAGPYTRPDPAINVHNAVQAGIRLLRGGHVPYVPHAMTHMMHLIHPLPYEDWLRCDLGHLEGCEALVRLPGESPGADREVARAVELGIPVFAGIDEFFAWIEGRE